MTKIDTGLMLRTYFDKKRIRRTGLARKTGIGYQSILNLQVLENTDINKMLKICDGLEHNFFRDMAEMLPEHYTTEVVRDDDSKEVISSLEKKIIALEAQNELLLNLVKNRMK